jgi:hypothetical protein
MAPVSNVGHWTILVGCLSDATFGRGEGTAGEVDVEVEHDDDGLPLLGGKTLRGLLRDSWLTIEVSLPAGHPLRVAAREVFGPEGDLEEESILRIANATLPSAVTDWVRAALHDPARSLTPRDMLLSLTDVRHQTAEDRCTGAPARTTLRNSRVSLRGLEFESQLTWLREPADEELRCLALAVRATRHAGLGRNRGRGHVLLKLLDPERVDCTLALLEGVTA